MSHQPTYSDEKSRRIIDRHIKQILAAPTANRHLKGELLCNWRRRFGSNHIIFSIDYEVRVIDIVAIGPWQGIYGGP